MSLFNINVGILGHVDSGKTSLAKAMSTVASTSAFDKNPQSKIRGITLDLGFSSFVVDKCLLSPSVATRCTSPQIQFTLVDCPGHGSLIRTVLCGAKIIDLMLLVIDVTKGFQTQTSECLVIGSLTCNQLIVVLNKCDLIPESCRDSQIEKMKKRVTKTLETTKFINSPIVAVSAAPGGAQMDHCGDTSTPCNDDIKQLINLLAATVSDPTEHRQLVRDQEFLFAVDHCFPVSGQGTVLTGTVLAGTVRVGDLIELPYQRIQRKVKSIEMFRRKVNSIGPGDRAGMCVPQLDSSVLERGLIGSPSNSNLVPCYACVLSGVNKIPYFKSPIKSKARMHVFMGQETALTTMTFFRSADDHKQESCDSGISLDTIYEYVDALTDDFASGPGSQMFVLLEFERPLICPKGSLVIGVKLDSVSTTACRLAFHGTVAAQLTEQQYRSTFLPKLLVFRPKSRRGQIDRVLDPRTVIVRGLFKRETNWDIFIGLRARIEYRTLTHNENDGDHEANPPLSYPGHIESSFGQSGKCRLVLDCDLPESIVSQFSKKSAKKSTQPVDSGESGANEFVVVLEFKRYIFDPKRRLAQ